MEFLPEKKEVQDQLGICFGKSSFSWYVSYGPAKERISSDFSGSFSVSCCKGKEGAGH